MFIDADEDWSVYSEDSPRYADPLYTHIFSICLQQANVVQLQDGKRIYRLPAKMVGEVVRSSAKPSLLFVTQPLRIAASSNAREVLPLRLPNAGT